MPCRSHWLVASFILVASLSSNSAFALPEKDTGNLGEIRYSILSPDNFQRIYGAGWVLMDGRDVQDTDLYRERLWENHTIPDSRGRFLRCHNHGRNPSTGNPDGDIGVGDFQADQFGSHSHKLQWAGTPFVARRADSCELGTGLQSGPCFGDSGKSGITRGVAYSPESAGGNETRPRCVTVNTYIKINRTVENQQTQIFIETLESLPTRILENERLRGVLRQMIREEVRK